MTKYVGIPLFVVVLLVLLIFITPACRPKDTRNVRDMIDLRTIAMWHFVHAAEHDGLFPDHIADVDPELMGFMSSEEISELFASSKDSASQLDLTVKNPQPTDWYQHGSYWFYPTHGLTEDSVTQPSSFILVYREPYDDLDKYIVALLDGSSYALDEKEFVELKNAQEELISEVADDNQ